MKIYDNMNKKFDSLAPCGVYCGACPSFNKTCKGFASDDKEQKRCSKWSCKIRNCCYNEKELDFCIDCNHFPCKIIYKKLVNTHQDDPRFKYRHEIPDIFMKLKTMNLDSFLSFQTQRWKCDLCGGTIQFYLYKCGNCGQEHIINQI
jgi:hypothetical protein